MATETSERKGRARAQVLRTLHAAGDTQVVVPVHAAHDPELGHPQTPDDAGTPRLDLPLDQLERGPGRADLRLGCLRRRGLHRLGRGLGRRRLDLGPQPGGRLADHRRERPWLVRTAGRRLVRFIGACDRCGLDAGLAELGLEVVAEGEDGQTNAEWLQRAARFGVWKKHDRLVVPRAGESPDDAERIERKREFAAERRRFITGVAFTVPLFVLSMGRDFGLAILAEGLATRISEEELAKYGTVNVRHAHGDWNNSALAGWSGELHPHAIRPMQQFAYTKGKNATDSALIIDAMDLLHTGRFDGFVLVSSDSDFTSLANRIREQGLDVIGIGANLGCLSGAVPSIDELMHEETYATGEVVVVNEKYRVRLTEVIIPMELIERLRLTRHQIFGWCF